MDLLCQSGRDTPILMAARWTGLRQPDTLTLPSDTTRNRPLIARGMFEAMLSLD
jgi:hypothetical protein